MVILIEGDVSPLAESTDSWNDSISVGALHEWHILLDPSHILDSFTDALAVIRIVDDVSLLQPPIVFRPSLRAEHFIPLPFIQHVVHSVERSLAPSYSISKLDLLCIQLLSPLWFQVCKSALSFRSLVVWI